MYGQIGGETVKGKAFIGVFIWSFILWLLLTMSIDIWEIAVGLVIALFVAFGSASMLEGSQWVDVMVNPVKWLMFAVYLVILWREIVKASVDVWLRAFGLKKPDVKAGVVEIEVPNESVESMVMLANSITLTPGTITAKVVPDEKKLYIHWIDVGDRDRWYEDIASALNKGVRRVLP